MIMTVDERELHDLEMLLKCVRSQSNIVSIGSVRCCTSARRANRMSWKGVSIIYEELHYFGAYNYLNAREQLLSLLSLENLD